MGDLRVGYRPSRKNFQKGGALKIPESRLHPTGTGGEGWWEPLDERVRFLFAIYRPRSLRDSLHG